MPSQRLATLFLFVSVALAVLNPYTIAGKPGLVAVFGFALYGCAQGIAAPFFRQVLMPGLILLTLATFGLLSSVMHSIPQANHPAAVVSLLAVLLGGRGMFLYGRKHGIGAQDFLLMILATMVLNSVIILLELQFDPLRQAIESMLDPLLGGSINYASGFRFRGIAASGGASLSISIPASVVLALYLYHEGRLRTLTLVLIVFILLSSVIVIGRSGIVLIAVPVAGYIYLLVQQTKGAARILRRVAVTVGVLALLLPLFFQLATDFFTEMFGEAFIKYAFGFLLEGEEGIRDEGTVDTVAGFLTVLPLGFPEALTGYGFYGGSDFYPWTDSGYSRMFLSIGFVLGLCFYAVLLRIYTLELRHHSFLFGSLVLILLIAEAKEPLLFSGVASRMFLLSLMFYYCRRTEPVPAAAAPLAAGSVP